MRKPVTLMVAVAIVASVPVAGIVATPAGAAAASYATTTQSRTVETFSKLPFDVTQGYPSSTVFLDHQGVAQCEVLAAMFDGGILEEYFELGFGGTYQNHTKAEAGNQRGALPEKAAFGAAPGPNAQAACPTPLSGSGYAAGGGYLSDQVSIESASTSSTATKPEGKAIVLSETLTKLQGIKAGAVSVRNLESWIKVEWRSEEEPLISYRMAVSGLFNGADEVLLQGERGIVLQGQNVAGNEFVKQFNQQSAEHETAFEQLFTYGFRILEPKVYQDASGRDVIESFVMAGGFGLAARKGELGGFQGMRLAAARITGRIGSFAS
jgi:hypothetical protein